MKNMSNLKIADALKKKFESMSQEELDAEWEELKHWNEIGPECDEYFESLKKLAYIHKIKIHDKILFKRTCESI